MLLLHLIIQLWSIRNTHGSNRLIDGYMNPLWHCPLMHQLTHFRRLRIQKLFPLLDHIWTIVHQADAFLNLLLIIHLNAYLLLIGTFSAEALGTDHPSASSSSLTSNTVMKTILLHDCGLAVTVTIIF